MDSETVVVLVTLCVLVIIVMWAIKLCREEIANEAEEQKKIQLLRKLNRDRFIKKCELIISETECITDDSTVNQLHTKYTDGKLNRFIVYYEEYKSVQDEWIDTIGDFDTVGVIEHYIYDYICDYIYDTEDKEVLTYDEFCNKFDIVKI